MKVSTRSSVVALYSSALVVAATASARQAAPRPLGALVVPSGFRFEVFAENVGNGRMMVLGPQGTVFVGSQYAGNVYAVVDRDGDHKADRVVTIATGLRQPNGVAMRNGALYVATTSQILRFDNIEKHLDAPPAPGARSPLQWGTDGHVRNLFPGVVKIAHTARHFAFRYRSPQHFIDVFRTYYGPVHKAFASLDAARQDTLEAEMGALLRRSNVDGAANLVVPGQYLETVITV